MSRRPGTSGWWPSWSSSSGWPSWSVSERNRRWSLAHGGVETGAGHYPVMVLLHTGLLVGAWSRCWPLDRPFLPWLGWPMLALRGGRAGAALVVHQRRSAGSGAPGSSSCRACRRSPPGRTGGCGTPTTWPWCVEGVALPLVHTAWVTAAVFTVVNAVLLRVRIAAEEQALQALSPLTAVTDVDLLVAGGGPVGLAVAIGARAAGLSVVVVEPRDDPGRQGLRRGPDAGGGRRARPARRRRRPAGRSSGSATWRRAGRWPRASGAGPGLGVRRTALHAALAARAEQVGRRPVRGHASARSSRTATGSRPPGSGRGWLVAADGLHSPVRRQLGLQTPGPGPAGRYGLRRHFAGRARGPARRGALGRARRGLRDAGAATDWSASRARRPRRDVPYDEAAGRLPGPARPAARGRAGHRPCAGPARCGSRPGRRGPGGCCWSATPPGYVDALTGEGVAVGLATAPGGGGRDRRRPARGLPAAWRRATRRYRWSATALLAVAARPGPAPPAGPGRPRPLPAVFGLAVDQVA